MEEMLRLPTSLPMTNAVTKTVDRNVKLSYYSILLLCELDREDINNAQ